MSITDEAGQLDRRRLVRGIPLPTLYPWNRQFFAGGIEGKLRLQRCLQCKELIYYPRMVCPRCLSSDYEWETLSGLGSVYSFAIVWRPKHPAFAEHVPIVLAVVDLREGPQMVSTIVNCPADRVTIGMELAVVFDTIADGIALPKFEPADVTATSSRTIR